jgi:HEAT repeat protein
MLLRLLIAVCLAPALAGMMAEVAASSVLAAPPDAEKCLAGDLKLLKDAGVKTDGPGLVEFFRKEIMSEAQRRGIEEAISQLGDDSFEVREKATRKLIALGHAAVPALQRALKHRDLEIVRRARWCLDALKGIPPAELRAAAARALIVRKPPEGAQVLLAFLPDAADTAEEDRIVAALTALGVREGKVDRALITALTDKLPLRRAFAAEVLAAGGGANDRAAIRKLLADADRGVRLHVAVALTYARDKAAVPVLIDVTADLPPDRTREAQELLRLLAGAKAPRTAPGGHAAARKRYRDDWNAWWKEHGTAVDLARVEAGPPSKAKVAARASATWNKDVTPDKPFDLDRPGFWSSGGYAPQWIEADLGATNRLAKLRMTPSQLPEECDTTHEIWASEEPIGDNCTKAKLIHTFKGRTESGRPLAFDFPKGLSARYIQIRTTASASWVAWIHIELQVGRIRSRFVQDDGK